MMKKVLVGIGICISCIIAGTVFGQNPTLGDTNRLCNTIMGKLGLYTNGATVGQVPVYNGPNVGWGTGLGGGDVFRASNNVFTGINTFTTNINLFGPRVLGNGGIITNFSTIYAADFSFENQIALRELAGVWGRIKMQAPNVGGMPGGFSVQSDTTNLVLFADANGGAFSAGIYYYDGVLGFRPAFQTFNTTNLVQILRGGGLVEFGNGGIGSSSNANVVVNGPFRVNGLATITNFLNMSGTRVTNAAPGINTTDYVTVGQVNSSNATFSLAGVAFLATNQVFTATNVFNTVTTNNGNAFFLGKVAINTNAVATAHQLSVVGGVRIEGTNGNGGTPLTITGVGSTNGVVNLSPNVGQTNTIHFGQNGGAGMGDLGFLPSSLNMIFRLGASLGTSTNHVEIVNDASVNFFAFDGVNTNVIINPAANPHSIQVLQNNAALNGAILLSTGLVFQGSGFHEIRCSSTGNARFQLRGESGAGAGIDLKSGSDGLIKFCTQDQGVRIGPAGTTNIFLTGHCYTNLTVDIPVSIAASTVYSTNFNLTGCSNGCPVTLGLTVLEDDLQWSAFCTNNGVATVRVLNYNPISAGVNPASKTINLRAFQP